MAGNYCTEFFYPEFGCDCPYLCAKGQCKKEATCIRQVYLTEKEYVILDNLRIVKLQNAKILELLQKQK